MCRNLFILGNLLQFGLDTITSLETACTAEACLDVFLDLLMLPAGAASGLLGQMVLCQMLEPQTIALQLAVCLLPALGDSDELCQDASPLQPADIICIMLQLNAAVVVVSQSAQSPRFKRITSALLSHACLGGAGMKVQEQALTALGCLAVAQPDVLADERASELLQKAMHQDSPVPLKTRALSVLLDMLRVRGGVTTMPCQAELSL